MPNFPSPEMVAVAWLKTVAGLDASKVATTLPADDSVWADTGFVRVATVGGTPNPHVPMWGPVVSIECWACNPNSQKPPWGKAGHLASLIQWATYQAPQPGVLALESGFHNARLVSVRPLSEPRRITGDEAGFARVQFDAAFQWVLQEVA